MEADSAFLGQHALGPWKITMPGAMSAAGTLFKQGVTDQFYATRWDLAAEVVEMLRREIDALAAEGVSYIQLDSLHYVERVTDNTVRARMIADGEDPDEYLDRLIECDNQVLDAARAAGVTVGLHMCRGNNRSAWHAEGSYEAMAEKAFNGLRVDRFLLEYDTERAGGFEPLRFMPKGVTVVLGIVSSKEPELESVDALKARIDEASKYVAVDNLAISPQCGFASTQWGNLLTWDDQRRKLELRGGDGPSRLGLAPPTAPPPARSPASRCSAAGSLETPSSPRMRWRPPPGPAGECQAGHPPSRPAAG